MSLIRCEGLGLHYEGLVALENINFHVEMGDYLCIVGENGAGKSSLMKVLLHLKKASTGKLIWGENLKPQEIGYLPQQTVVQKDFPASVQEVVLSGCLNRLGFKTFYTKKEKELAQHNMERMGIAALKQKSYRELSGGQQQRVLLARALCATRQLLLLDEPAAGLDPLVSQEFYELIRKVNRELGITVIMVSHDIRSCLQYASHVLHLRKQQLFFGNVKDYNESSVGKKFLGGEDA